MSPAGRDLVPVVTVPVRREGRGWVVEVPAEGVWTHGRTLAEACDRSRAAIALARNIAPDHIAVKVQVDCPEMDALAAARESERAALAAAVVRLRSQAVPWPETARALGVSQHDARLAWEAAVAANPP